MKVKLIFFPNVLPV